MSAPERLHPDDLAALAVLVAEEVVARLGGVPQAQTASALLTAAEVARRFGVTAGWARENADRLGAIRLGTGPKARMRFDVEKVAAALSVSEFRKRSVPEDSRRALEKRPRRSPTSGKGPGPLPIFTVNSPESEKKSGRAAR